MTGTAPVLLVGRRAGRRRRGRLGGRPHRRRSDTETQATNPIMRWEWLFVREDTRGELWDATLQHLQLTLMAVGHRAGASPPGWPPSRCGSGGRSRPSPRSPGFLYTIPSVALFGLLGTRFGNTMSAEIALVELHAARARAEHRRRHRRRARRGHRRRRRPRAVADAPAAHRRAAARAARHRRRHPRRHGHDGRPRRDHAPSSSSADSGGSSSTGTARSTTRRSSSGSALSVLLALVLDVAFNRIEIAAHPLGAAAGGVVSLLLLRAPGADEPTNVLEWFTDRAARRQRGQHPRAAVARRSGTRPWRSWSSSRSPSRSPPSSPTTAGASWRPPSWSASAGPSPPSPSSASLVIVSLRNGFGLEPWPIIVALVLLGLPPVFANTYAAVRGVDPSPVERGAGHGLDPPPGAAPGRAAARPARHPRRRAHRRRADRRHRAARRVLRGRGPRRVPAPGPEHPATRSRCRPARCSSPPPPSPPSSSSSALGRVFVPDGIRGRFAEPPVRGGTCARRTAPATV